ncbi:A/G-specific adenine glycosylase [Massilimicrobiota timonensis]|uniref:A/G-specific adenine glycosylase n=1 Tax=Massilimicrobiota timonensis TaxID=1776392 RepID=UPI001961E5B3|nr:A/G-specific adenine glycosylase [Massilimicrobiota timonensis]MBM6965114.1 A/G-specific adenine glycosylase [Massilimicrobiota timonensis]
MQKNIQNNLITWYNKNLRHFPWRETANPYYIWISEIMLQQTTTEAVIPYYTRFIETFDTIDKLAKASLEDVYKLWEGLGYYRRAKHIHETAQFICENFDGQFPTTYKDILNLKGIGPYTAGAICSIAYGMSTPAIDGNVLRIISRLYALTDNIALTKTQKKISQIVSELLIGYDASSFNQGLMDLGATICRPLNPQCQNCPIAAFCKAKEIGQQKVLPISIKNIKHKELNYITGIITYQEQYLMIQNPAGLLENLYGFIQYELESPYRFMEEFEKQYHLPLSLVSYHGQVKHVFTHRTWHMHIYHFTLSHPYNTMYHLEDISQIPVSTAHLKVLKHYLKQK